MGHFGIWGLEFGVSGLESRSLEIGFLNSKLKTPTFLDSTSFWMPASVVGHRRDVADAGHFEARSLERSNRSLTARARSSHEHFDPAKPVLLCNSAGFIGSDLGGKRRTLSAAFEVHVSGTRPAQCVARRIGDRDDRVVE